MRNPPSIRVDYRPVRIGWVIPGRDVAQLGTTARRNACLWGGRYNCIIPTDDLALADRLVASFGVDVLLPVQADNAATAFINRFPHLEHQRWHDSIFDGHGCEYLDVRHALRRLIAQQDREAERLLRLPVWQDDDPLAPLFAMMFGAYPTSTDQIPDYKAAIQKAFGTIETFIAADAPLPPELLGGISPLALTGYDLSHAYRRGRLQPGVVLGSVSDFDALLMFWNLRAAGAPLFFYDQIHSSRLKPFADAFLARVREPEQVRASPIVEFWIRADGDDSWKDLAIDGLQFSLSDGRSLWNSRNTVSDQACLSAWQRDVVPTYTEADGKASVSFSLPDRPFSDDDVQSLSQKFAVVVDARQYGDPDADFTFKTPFVRRLNEFYGRNIYFQYDAVRSQLSRMRGGAVALISPISTQNLTIRAFRVFDWLTAFFTLCHMNIARSEAGLRCERLITQLGGLQGCRVLKIRGVRMLLRKYSVEQHFTRSSAVTAIRDVDANTQAVGFGSFRRLYIEYREKDDLTLDDVLHYLLSRRVFRVGLELTCPNCQLPSWVHLDEIKTQSACAYCDHRYDVTPQLKDRDWRYRRSGIFGRDDNQLGGVPVALTLQQLSSTLRERVLMYATGVIFAPDGAAIEPCESDFVVVSEGAGTSEAPIQIVLGEAKSEGAFDAEDVRKLCKLADAVPRELADVFVLFSKTGTFSPEACQGARIAPRHHVVA
jgi:hypothetical protein